MPVDWRAETPLPGKVVSTTVEARRAECPSVARGGPRVRARDGRGFMASWWLLWDGDPYVGVMTPHSSTVMYHMQVGIYAFCLHLVRS